MSQSGFGSSRKDPRKGTQTILSEDELQLLEVYRKAKRLGHADIHVAIQEGARVKLWLTEKLK